MFPRPLRRLAALAALAAVAALGFIAPVPAAQAHRGTNHQHIDTDLSIAKEALGDDGVGAVTGRLSARRVPLADRAVYLLVKHDDWVRVRSERTDRQGRVSFAVSPEVPTTYRLLFAGGGRFEPSRSAAVQLAPPTTAAVTATADPAVIDPGGTATVSAVVTDDDLPLAGAAVELRGRTRNADGFEVVATGTTADDGTVAFAVTPERTTRYVVRLVRTEERRGASSNPVVVAVRAATHLSIRKDTFGDVIAVAGLLKSQGRALPDREVTLQQLDPGATEWVDAATKTTKRDGWVGFRRDLVVGTSYRLFFAGAPRLAAATSRTVIA